MGQRFLFSLSALGLVAVAGHFAQQLTGQVQADSAHHGLEAHETQAGASLLGQFRTSLSGWLWLKTDLYLHNGVELRAQTEQEAASGEKQVRDSDGWHDAIGDEIRHTTAIPAAEKDPRGLLGELERVTQTYRDMNGHRHVEPKSVLPLFRLMTWADPQFESGWTVGATLIANQRDRSALSKAIEFLNEGLCQNPDSIELRVELARLMISRERGIIPSVPLLIQACDLVESSQAWRDVEGATGSLDAFRWLCLCYREMGQHALAASTAKRGLRLFFGDPFLMRMQRPAPAIWTVECQSAYYSEMARGSGHDMGDSKREHGDPALDESQGHEGGHGHEDHAR